MPLQLVALKPLISLISRLVACSARIVVDRSTSGHAMAMRQRANFRNFINNYVNAEVRPWAIFGEDDWPVLVAIYIWFQRASIRETARLYGDVTAEWLQPKRISEVSF